MPKGPRGEQRPADVFDAAGKAARTTIDEEEGERPPQASAVAQLGKLEGAASSKATNPERRADVIKTVTARPWQNEDGREQKSLLLNIAPKLPGQSLAQCTGIRQTRVEGNPDRRHFSSSYIERQHFAMRSSMRRFTRLTNAFSNQAENHTHALATYFTFYNLAPIHRKLRVTGATGVLDRLWSMEGVTALSDARTESAKTRGPYKGRAV